MRAIPTFVLVSVLMAVGAGPASAQAVQYLGPSNDAGPSGTGVLGFNALCQATYGKKARLCTSQDVLGSGALPSGPQTLMWVIPVIVESAADPTYGTVVFDASGLAAPMEVGGGIFSALDCGGWRVTGAIHGLATDAQGTFQRATCDTDRPAACCKAKHKGR